MPREVVPFSLYLNDPYLAVAMALGMFFATSLDVKRVYWFGPLMYPFLTAFMNVVDWGGKTE